MFINNFQDPFFLRLHLELKEGREDSATSEISEGEYMTFFGRQSDEDGTEETDAFVNAACEAAIDEHFDLPARPRRIVRVRRTLGPIPAEALPLVAEAQHFYRSALSGMINEALASFLDDEQDTSDPSEKYDEYDRLDTPACANGRRAQLLAQSPRTRRAA